MGLYLDVLKQKSGKTFDNKSRNLIRSIKVSGLNPNELVIDTFPHYSTIIIKVFRYF